MTRKQAINKFRKMWKEIGELGLTDKNDSPTLQAEKTDIFNNCFLCEYSINEMGKKGVGPYYDEVNYCDHCPIEWPISKENPPDSFYCEFYKKIYNCYDAPGLWLQWIVACTKSNMNKAKKIALQISELPERIKDK